MANPFSAKAGIKIKITPVEDSKPAQKKSNPFAAKAKPKNNKPNPFAQRAKNGGKERLAELDRMIVEAEQRYEESLAKALKGGVNRAQIKKLFDVSDRHMNTLLALGRQRRLHLGERTHVKENTGLWTEHKKKRSRGVTQRKASESSSLSQALAHKQSKPSKQKKSSPQAAAPKKKGSTPKAGGRARRTRRRH